MNEISIEEYNTLTKGEIEHPIIENENNVDNNSLVTLKKVPTGYVMQVSCDNMDLSKFYFSEDFELINKLCQNFIVTLKEKGNPFLDNGMSKEELAELASQLGNPTGEKGIMVGQMMNESNISMTRNTIDKLELKSDEKILELGHGNANHVLELLNTIKDSTYFGLDISETMNIEAENFCKENGLQKRASFYLYDGISIPFEDNLFDKIFTVNTLYFWQKPLDLLNELGRVLKPGGVICITFIDEKTMKMMPFTDYGFNKYSLGKFTELINNSNLKIVSTNQYSETLKSKVLGKMERNYWVMKLGKS